MVIYRHMEQKYIKECIEEGKFRISTLYKYHDVENLRVGISDAIEGGVVVHLDYHVVENEDFRFGNLIHIKGGSGVLQNCTQTNYTSNSFITSFSQQGFMPLRDGLGFGSADSSMIINIENIGLFIQCVSEKLVGQGYKVFYNNFCEVRYVSKARKYDPQNPHIFYTDEFEKINDPIYTVQKEIRAVWRVNPIPQIDYIDIQDDRLKHCFRLP